MIKLMAKTGIIFLILLLVLSTSGFILVKTISANPPPDPSAYTKTTFTLSAHIGDPFTWHTYENQNFGYKIRHPNHWTYEENNRISYNILSTYVANLNNKIKLTVSVNNAYNIPKNAPTLTINNIDFYLITDGNHAKSAVCAKDNFFYKIDLEENNFFENSTDYRSTFYTILKNFQFTN